MKKEFVFIDQPTPSCHASTLVRLDNGVTVAAWFGGTKESENDVDIWVAVRNENGWGTPQRISADDNVPHWNPVLFAIDNTVHLFFKVGKKISDWQTYVACSNDNGVTWSKPVQLVEGDTSGGRGPVKNKPVMLKNGTIIAPASVERGPWRPFMDISNDKGKTWHKTQLILPEDEAHSEDIWMIQPTLWADDEKTVHAFLRTNQGFIYRTDSVDGGLTWCKAYKTKLPNNNSGIDVTRLIDGRIAIVLNPNSSNFGPRTPLSLWISNNGIDFTEVTQLENTDGEYSYPSIISNGTTVYITYTWKRLRIAYAEIQL